MDFDPYNPSPFIPSYRSSVPAMVSALSWIAILLGGVLALMQVSAMARWVPSTFRYMSSNTFLPPTQRLLLTYHVLNAFLITAAAITGVCAGIMCLNLNPSGRRLLVAIAIALLVLKGLKILVVAGTYWPHMDWVRGMFLPTGSAFQWTTSLLWLFYELAFPIWVLCTLRSDSVKAVFGGLRAAGFEPRMGGPGSFSRPPAGAPMPVNPPGALPPPPLPPLPGTDVRNRDR